MRSTFAMLLTLVLALGVSGCNGTSPNATGEAWTAREGSYPAGPYGTNSGSRITNHTFQLPTDTGATESFSLEANVWRPGAKVLLLVTAAEWCTACRDEAPKLQALYDEFHDAGLEVVTAMFEDAETGPAGPSHAATWADLYDLTHPVVADPDFEMQAYYDPNNTPLVMLIDVDDMSIQYQTVGLAEADVRAIINALL